MPYVSKELREKWAQLVWEMTAPGLGRTATPGEINYVVTKLLLAWMGLDPRYMDYNAAIGVLECI